MVKKYIPLYESIGIDDNDFKKILPYLLRMEKEYLNNKNNIIIILISDFVNKLNKWFKITNLENLITSYTLIGSIGEKMLKRKVDKKIIYNIIEMLNKAFEKAGKAKL